MNLTDQIKKASLVGAFFYAIFIPVALAECVMPSNANASRLHGVTDGDTIKLTGGTTVRLLGINTPELGRGARKEQPLARESTKALQALLTDVIFLVDGDKPQDRYGRRLSHVFNESGRSAEEQLIAQGLGFFIGSDRQTGMADCLREAENQARKAKLGLWREPYWLPMDVASDALRAGFVVLKGRIDRVEHTRAAVWIETRGNVVLRVDRSELQRFPDSWWKSLSDREFIIKGWLVDRKGRQGPHKRWLMRLMYPDMMVALD